MLNGKNILITVEPVPSVLAFVKYILDNHRPKKVIVFSRDEMKQWEMANDSQEQYFAIFYRRR